MKSAQQAAHLQQQTKQLETSTGSIIRRYAAADHPRIADICKNVYGGSDVLPRTIQTQLVHNNAATVLVSQPAADKAVSGVVCAELRGDSSYLFGLRVTEEARGKGVASQLLAAACYHSCSHGHIQHIQSTTIPPNTPPLRVFRKLGFTHSRTVDRWPQEHLQLGYEAAVGFAPNTQQPQQPVQFAPQQPHMLDHIPGARQVIRKTAAGVQPSDWVCCRNVQQLQQAVASIRQQQEQLGQHCYDRVGEAGYVPPLDWLPWVFEVQPLSTAWVQQRAAAGEVWLLPAPHAPGHAQHNSAYAAAVVLSHSELNSRTCAGILAVQESGVAAALELVDSKVPHFVAYIDSGSRHSSGRVDPELQLPPVLNLARQGLPVDKPYMCYLVYSRPASHDGLPLAEALGTSSRM